MGAQGSPGQGHGEDKDTEQPGTGKQVSQLDQWRHGDVRAGAGIETRGEGGQRGTGLECQRWRDGDIAGLSGNGMSGSWDSQVQGGHRGARVGGMGGDIGRWGHGVWGHWGVRAGGVGT